MRITIVGLTALPLLAACAGSSGAHSHATGSPAVSKRQAEQVLTDYQTANNKANRALDAAALGTVETGAQLSMDVAGYKLHRVTKEGFRDFSFVKPVFYIPRLTGYPHWFAVDAAAAAKPAGTVQPLRHALLFRQETASAPWRLAADPFVSGSGTPLSAIALDSDGYATPVAPDAGHLALSPSKMASAHAEVLNSGLGPVGSSVPGATALAKGPQTSQAYDALQQARGGFAKLGVSLTSRFTPSTQPTYALRTTDGGAVVWYVLQQQETYAASKPGTLSITGDLVGLAPAGRVDRRLDTTVLVQYLASVPAEGTATVSGMYRKAIQATAS